MNSEKILEVIEKYNLSIRRIPDKIIISYDIRHKKEGDFIIVRNNREFAQNTRIPIHAGWYMAKQINNSDTIVRWDIKTDNLAPTLERSIELFLETIK